MSNDWVTFFTVVAGATAAIFALMFVAMQTRSNVWTHRYIDTYAVGFTLAELAAPLFVSLIALLPSHNWRLGSFVVGVVGLGLVVGQLCATARAIFDKEAASLTRMNWWQLAGSILLSGPMFSVFVSAAVYTEIGWIGWVCVWFIFSGITEAFLLLAVQRDRGQPSIEAPISSD